MLRFKVGDRVVLLDGKRGVYRGVSTERGHYFEGWYAIDLDNFDDGHHCRGLTARGGGLWVRPHEVVADDPLHAAISDYCARELGR